MRYVSAFDGKTLHDGTNRWSKNHLPINSTASANAELMADQTLFDPNYGTGSPTVPQPFTAVFVMRFATEAAAEAEEAALKAKIGDNGTVTASLTGGGAAETCNATLENVTVQYGSNGRNFRATLAFQPFEDWS